MVNGPVKWLQALIRIPSVNPDVSAECADVVGEGRLAEFLFAKMSAFGFDVVRDPAAPGRDNVYCFVEPPGADAQIAVDTHIDTVGVSDMTISPFCGTLAKNRVFGRGAVDSKASLAIMLHLLERVRFRAAKLRAKLLLACTVGEESCGIGARAFARWVKRRGLRIDNLIVGEPTQLYPVYCHNSFVTLGYRLKPRADSAYPPADIGAWSQMLPATAAAASELDTYGFGPNTARKLLHISWAHGIDPSRCDPYRAMILLKRQVLIGENAADQLRLLHFIAEQAAEKSGIALERCRRGAGRQFIGNPLDTLTQSLARLSNHAPVPLIDGATNAAYYKDIAKNVTVFGPGSQAASHTADESIEVSQLEAGQEIFSRMLLA